MATAKKGMGRTKIEIKKIEDEGHLKVAFSKRRSGLFKKAIELATLCGIELVVIVFSPAGRPFSYGHPHVDTVIDRYLNSNNEMPDQDAALQLMDFQRSAAMRELEEQYNDLKQQLDELNKKALEEMKRLAAIRGGDENIDDRNDKLEIIEKLNMEELEEMKGLMEDIQMKIFRRYDEIMSSTQPAPMPHLTMTAENATISPFVAENRHRHHQANGHYEFI